MRRRRRRPEDEFADYYDESTREPVRSPATKPSQPSWAKHVWLIAVCGCLLLAAIWLIAGTAMLEKTLQALVAPCGLLWLGLLLCTYMALVGKNAFVFVVALLSWLVLTLAGNAIVSGWMVHAIEREYLNFQVDDVEPLDIAVVLGGGATTAAGGRAQFGSSGDRVVLAARMFHDGKVERIICSGTSGLPRPDGAMTAGEASARLLIQMGVPEEKILLIDGRNTMEEIQSLDRWLAKQERRDLRVGIITSAWHVKRSLRLAKTVGLDVTAIPADFLSRPYRTAPDLLIPSVNNVSRTTIVAKEWLAELVGR